MDGSEGFGDDFDDFEQGAEGEEDDFGDFDEGTDDVQATASESIPPSPAPDPLAHLVSSINHVSSLNSPHVMQKLTIHCSLN